MKEVLIDLEELERLKKVDYKYQHLKEQVKSRNDEYAWMGITCVIVVAIIGFFFGHVKNMTNNYIIFVSGILSGIVCTSKVMRIKLEEKSK